MINKTFVVTGAPRCGTSMIAGIIRILGIPMGEKINPDKHEDKDFFRADANKLRHLIKQRDDTYPIWGWKDPWVMLRLTQIHKHLRKPKFIFIFRDPLMAAISDIEKNMNNKIPYALSRTMKIQASMTTFFELHQARYSFLLLSYEQKMTEGPEGMIDAIMKFCGLQPSNPNHKIVRQQCIEFSAERGYKSLE